MYPTRVLILITLTLLFSACGGKTEPEQAITEPASQQSVNPADSSGKPVEVIEVIEESAGEKTAVDEKVGDKIVLAQTETPAATTTQKFSAGIDYVKLTTAQGTSSPPDVIEVAEVFWYGCPHCFTFDPIVNDWAEHLPDDVNFIRIPVMWNPTNAIHARLYYTLEALGMLDVEHAAVFNELHINKKSLTNEAEILEFIDEQGISVDDFNKTFRSFAVESKLKRATNLTKRYRIQSVPLLVINGKYLTSGKGIKNFNDMLAVADELIAMEKQNR
jgi:protein dithiol oxidoreductase (disulfide-forming)